MRVRAYFFGLVLTGISLIVARAEEPQEVTVVYPTQATEAVELDSSTPAKRVEPPTREDSEIDPVTPLGQIRAVLESLTRLETSQKSLEAQIKKTPQGDNLAQKADVTSIMTALTTGSEERAGLGERLDKLRETTENLRKTMEAIAEASESIEKLHDSKWSNYALIAILALMILQVVAKGGSFVYGNIKSAISRWEQISAAYATAKKQLDAAKDDK